MVRIVRGKSPNNYVVLEDDLQIHFSGPESMLAAQRVARALAADVLPGPDDDRPYGQFIRIDSDSRQTALHFGAGDETLLSVTTNDPDVISAKDRLRRIRFSL